MAQTARYCLNCLLELTPDNATSCEDQVILQAIGFEKGGFPDYETHHKIAGGICAKCGKDTVLVYYEIGERGSTTPPDAPL
jgi:hypothetical protein